MRTRREADSSATPATRLGKPSRRSGRRRREAVVVSNKPNRNRFDPSESIAGWSSGFRWPRRREEAICGSESTGIRDRSDYSELLGRSSSFSRPLPRVRSRSAPARLTQVMVTGEELCESDRESHEARGLGLAGRNEFLQRARRGLRHRDHISRGSRAKQVESCSVCLATRCTSSKVVMPFMTLSMPSA